MSINIKEELEKFSIDNSTSNLAESSKSVYMYAIKKFLKTDPNVQSMESYMDFLRKHVILHYSHENNSDVNRKSRRNFTYFDALAKYVEFKRRNETEQQNKSTYTKIIKLLRENKPKNFANKKMTDYLTIRQRFQVIKTLKEFKHRLIAKLCFELGMRSRSILTLKAQPGKPLINFQEVDGEVVGVIDFYNMKGGKFSRKFIFNKKLVEELREYINVAETDPEYIFLDKSKSYVGQKFNTIVNTNYHWYWKDLNVALEICGFDNTRWSTHAFRKNAAYDVYKETKDPYAIKEFLDHADFKTTERYLKNEGLVKDKVQIQKNYAHKIENEQG